MSHDRCPWIVWDGGRRYSCERCGDAYEMNMPAPLPLVVAIVKAWIRMHRGCAFTPRKA